MYNNILQKKKRKKKYGKFRQFYERFKVNINAYIRYPLCINDRTKRTYVIDYYL